MQYYATCFGTLYKTFLEVREESVNQFIVFYNQVERKVLVNQKYLYQKTYQNTLDTSGDTRTCKNNHILKCLLNIHQLLSNHSWPCGGRQKYILLLVSYT